MPGSTAQSLRVALSEPHWRDDPQFLATIVETQSDIAAVELDPEMVMSIVVARTQRLTSADGVMIEIAADGQEMVVRAASGISQPCKGFRIKSNISRDALLSGQIQYTADLTAGPQPETDRCQSSVRSQVVVPLYHLGQAVGILKVSSLQPNAFTPTHIAALRLMAGLVGAALGNASEVSAKKQLLAQRTVALEALRTSEQQFRGAFEHASIGMALVALDGRWVQVNHTVCQIVGYSEDELLATNFQAITHPDDLQTDLDFVRQLIFGEIPSYRLTKRYIHKNGQIVWIILSVSLVRDPSGRPLYFVSQIQDITQSRRRELLEADHRKILEMVARDHPLESTMEQIAAMLERQVEGATASLLLVEPSAIWQVAPNLPSELAAAIQSRAFSLAAGLSNGHTTLNVSRVADDLVWQPLRDVALSHGMKVCWATVIRSADGVPHGLITLYCKHERSPVESDVESMDAGANLATIAIEHHTAASRMAHLTQHDALTGLPNRVLYQDRIEQALAMSRRSGSHVAVMVIDLDHFKSINDNLGHQAGDHLLQMLAQRLRSCIRETDTLARVGGDEFIAVLPELPAKDIAERIAAELLESLAAPFEIGGSRLTVSASIGMAVSPDDGQTPIQLQERADAALYRAKRNGRNQFSV